MAGGLLVFSACISGDGRPKQIERGPDSASVEREIIAHANTLRTERRLPPLQVDRMLSRKARDWSTKMAEEGRLSHSPLSAGVPGGWERLGENVGHGTSAKSVHEAFVASSRHLANLTNPSFTHLGVGVAPGHDGTLYVNQVMMEAARVNPPPEGPPPADTARPVGKPPPPPAGELSPGRPAPSVPPGRRADPVRTIPSARLTHVLRLLRELDG